MRRQYLRLAAPLCAAVLTSLPVHARSSKGGIDDAAGAYAAVASIERARPNPRLTPGAVDPRVTQANIRETICVRGYTKAVRPPQQFTHDLKLRQIRLYGYSPSVGPDRDSIAVNERAIKAVGELYAGRGMGAQLAQSPRAWRFSSLKIDTSAAASAAIAAGVATSCPSGRRGGGNAGKDGSVIACS